VSLYAELAHQAPRAAALDRLVGWIPRESRLLYQPHQWLVVPSLINDHPTMFVEAPPGSEGWAWYRSDLRPPVPTHAFKAHGIDLSGYYRGRLVYRAVYGYSVREDDRAIREIVWVMNDLVGVFLNLAERVAGLNLSRSANYY
jgi:hypothetical protein